MTAQWRRTRRVRSTTIARTATNAGSAAKRVCERSQEERGCHDALSSTHCAPKKGRGRKMTATRNPKNIGRMALVLFLLAGAAVADAQVPPAAQVDILIKNGDVVDGTGAPWFQADVAITGDKI